MQLFPGLFVDRSGWIYSVFSPAVMGEFEVARVGSTLLSMCLKWHRAEAQPDSTQPSPLNPKYTIFLTDLH